MLLGVHCSIQGGLVQACREAASLEIDTFQIFTKNQRQWNEKVITADEKAAFRDGLKNSRVTVAFSHASYLINVASGDGVLQERSIRALAGEAQRCHDTGLAFTVVHPGAAKGHSLEDGIKTAIRSLRAALHATKDFGVKIALENTAGQGTGIGYRFEHLRQIMDGAGSARIGACFDTCHAFAAGYDMRTRRGCEATLREFDRLVGLENLCAIHLNDSKGDLGSRLDRHEHIGKGKLGLEPFRYLMNEFPNIPKVIETPKKDGMDAVNLGVLRGL